MNGLFISEIVLSVHSYMTRFAEGAGSRLGSPVRNPPLLSVSLVREFFNGRFISHTARRHRSGTAPNGM
jgi:hypothetical protein